MSPIYCGATELDDAPFLSASFADIACSSFAFCAFAINSSGICPVMFNIAGSKGCPANGELG